MVKPVHGLVAIVYVWRGNDRRIVSAPKATRTEARAFYQVMYGGKDKTGRTDWKRVDSQTDGQIKRAIADDPDSAA